MEPVRIEIPQHIRKVQFSARQRPVYFEWNGVSIKGKRSKLHVKYFKDKTDIPKDIKIEHLRDHFCIGQYHNNKLTFVTRDTRCLPGVADLVKTKDKYRLLIKTEDDLGDDVYTLLLCNPNVVNTPKFHLIRGQDFYNSKIREHQRGVIMDAIKECFRPHLVNIPVITGYPVRIVCEVHDTIKNVYDNTKTQLGLPWDLDNYAYPYMKAFPDIMQKLGKFPNDDRLHITQPPSPLFVPIENHEERKLVFIISKDERDVIVNNEVYRDFHGIKEDAGLLIEGVEEISPETEQKLRDFWQKQNNSSNEII